MEWRVRDVDTGKDLPDLLKWVKFSGASWTLDGKGLFYSRYDEPKADSALRDTNYFHKLYYHRLGTRQAEDKLVFDRPDNKEMSFGGNVTDCYAAVNTEIGHIAYLAGKLRQLK